MKARAETVTVPLKAKVVEPKIGLNIERRLQLTGYGWSSVQAASYVCAHGKPLRYACDCKPTSEVGSNSASQNVAIWTCTLEEL